MFHLCTTSEKPAIRVDTCKLTTDFGSSIYLIVSTYEFIRSPCSGAYIYLFGVWVYFGFGCTEHITTGRWKGRGNQYVQFVRVLYSKPPTNGKQLPAFPHEAVPGIEPRPQRWDARVLPLCHHGPSLEPITRKAKNTLCITSRLSESALFESCSVNC